jgi:hypothetical protein
MRHTVTGTFSALAALVALGCSEPQGSAPTAPPTYAVTQATCRFDVFGDLVKNYFPPNSRRTVRSLISQMESLFNAGDLAGATSKGFDVLFQVEVVTNAGTQVGTPADGSAFINATLACMQVGPVVLPIDFTGILIVALAIRGGPQDPPDPVITQDETAGIGIAPPATWASVLGQRVMILGENNPGANFNELLVGASANWSTIPVLTSIKPGAIMGLCVDISGRIRVEDIDGITGAHTLLALRDASFFLPCPQLPIPSPILPGSPPQVNVKGPVGGSATGFSDFGSVDPIAINMSYLTQPSTVKAGARITPAVRIFVQGNGGTPLPEVKIVVQLVTFSGNGQLSGTLTNVTGPSGIETLSNLRVSAPGTYALLATASLSGFTTVQLQSATFVVTP